MNPDTYSQLTTDTSIALVRDQIAQKICSKPFYSNLSAPQYLYNTITDMDHFPYTRYFRGVYHNDQPRVAEREAGWRPTVDCCYKKAVPCFGEITSRDYAKGYPRNCFEAPCSTVYPCYPKENHDKEALDVMLNRVCINRSP